MTNITFFAAYCIFAIAGAYFTYDVYRDSDPISGIPNWVFRLILPYLTIKAVLSAATLASSWWEVRVEPGAGKSHFPLFGIGPATPQRKSR